MAELSNHEVEYDDRDRYIGQWKVSEGQKEGEGVLIFSDGNRFVGKFKAGLCEGKGLLSFSDGSKYEGDFARGVFHGYGVYTRGDGMKFEGQFVDGQVKGLGLLTFSDGSNGRPRQEGVWTGSTLEQRRDATEAVNLAQQAATMARQSQGGKK